MVSTRSRAGVNKQADVGPSGPTNITPDLAAILDGQAKMQQELEDLKKRNADEMEALRQENSRSGERSKLIPPWKEKLRRRLRLQGPQPSNPQKKKANTTPLLTPSLPPNKHQSTTSPIPITDAACLPSSSQTMTFTTATTNKTTPWSSLLKLKTTLLRKSSSTRATLLTFFTRPPIKNSSSRTLPWSRMTNQSMAFLANKYPPAATSTFTPCFVTEPKPKPFPSASLSSTRPHPTMSS